MPTHGRRRIQRTLLPQGRRLLILLACLALLIGVAGTALISIGSTPTATVTAAPATVHDAWPPASVITESPSPAGSATAQASALPSEEADTTAPDAPETAVSPATLPPTLAPVAAPPASEPVTVTYERIGLQQAPVAQMEAPSQKSGVISPPTNPSNPDINFQPYWISTFGKPGNGATDTVYLVGHACTADCWKSSWSVFNRLGEAEVGDRISFQTETGTVTYEVTKKIINRKDVPEEKEDTWKKRPGEMRIIACYPGNFEDQNVTVFGKIVK